VASTARRKSTLVLWSDTQLDLFDSDEDVDGEIFEDGDDAGIKLVEIYVELR
jgi:hypothetical protein